MCAVPSWFLVALQSFKLLMFILYLSHSSCFCSLLPFILQPQPMQVVMTEGGSEVGEVKVGRGKRKNAGVNRRYSEEEYFVETAEEEDAKRSKRRRTADSSVVEVHVAAWMARAPNGPVSHYLVEAMDALNEFNTIEFDTDELNTAGSLLELGIDAEVANVDIDGLASAMDLD